MRKNRDGVYLNAMISDALFCMRVRFRGVRVRGLTRGRPPSLLQQHKRQPYRYYIEPNCSCQLHIRESPVNEKGMRRKLDIKIDNTRKI